jgi:DNA-binding transcriptional regulator YiaG
MVAHDPPTGVHDVFESLSCAICERPFYEHEQITNDPYLDPMFTPVELGGTVHRFAIPNLTKTERNAFGFFRDRRKQGLYEPPLPSPTERRRIREAAGVSPQALADAIHVSRWTIYRFERRAGYRNGERLPGREPVGQVRKLYADALRNLSSH